jgi:hypothetical protein
VWERQGPERRRAEQDEQCAGKTPEKCSGAADQTDQDRDRRAGDEHGGACHWRRNGGNEILHPSEPGHDSAAKYTEDAMRVDPTAELQSLGNVYSVPAVLES